MPQEFQVLQCFSCRTFQVHPVKKSPKWSCKLCGEKQSLKKAYGEGTGADCRRHVQRLNSLRGDREVTLQLNDAATGNGHGNLPAAGGYEVDQDDADSCHDNPLGSSSLWEQYLDTDQQVETDTGGTGDDNVGDGSVCFTTDRHVFNNARKTSQSHKRKAAKAEPLPFRWGQYSDQPHDPCVQDTTTQFYTSTQPNTAGKKRKLGVQFEHSKSADVNCLTYMPDTKHTLNYANCTADYDYLKSTQDTGKSMSSDDSSQDSTGVFTESGGMYITRHEYRGVVDNKENGGAGNSLDVHEPETDVSTIPSSSSSKWGKFTQAQKSVTAGTFVCVEIQKGLKETAHNIGVKSNVSGTPDKWNKYVDGNTGVNVNDGQQIIPAHEITPCSTRPVPNRRTSEISELPMQSKDEHIPRRNLKTITKLQSGVPLEVGSSGNIMHVKQPGRDDVYPGIFSSGELEDGDLDI